MTPSQQELEDRGVIYILSNPLMHGTYKIGLTRVPVSERIKSLRSTSLPLDFESIYEARSGHALQLEKYIHRALKDNRINSKREFFSFSTDDRAISAVNSAVMNFSPRKYTEKEG